MLKYWLPIGGKPFPGTRKISFVITHRVQLYTTHPIDSDKTDQKNLTLENAMTGKFAANKKKINKMW